MKTTIKLTETKLRDIILESVNKILSEAEGGPNLVRNRTSRYIFRINNGEYDMRIFKYGTDWIMELPNMDNEKVRRYAEERLAFLKSLEWYDGKGCVSKRIPRWLDPTSWD